MSEAEVAWASAQRARRRPELRIAVGSYVPAICSTDGKSAVRLREARFYVNALSFGGAVATCAIRPQYIITHMRTRQERGLVSSDSSSSSTLQHKHLA